MKCVLFLMILNSKKHEGQVPEMELALLFQISLLLYSEFLLVFAPHALKGQKLLAQGIALGNYGRKPVAL